jgi:hypothetical protein
MTGIGFADLKRLASAPSYAAALPRGTSPALESAFDTAFAHRP